jgi:uncharacterized protein (DUF1697 family)
MRTHVALLRGINVGGHNKVAMGDLRELVASLGHEDVVTYIQSGNVAFTSSRDDAERLADELEREIEGRIGVQCQVIVLTRAQLAQAIADNPYPEETNPRSLHAVFGREKFSAERVHAVEAAVAQVRKAGSSDEAAVVESRLYLRTPDGLGRSQLAAALARSVTNQTGTSRNWATVTKLMALLEG